jgi:dTDP-4-amino-4,6-dideoxygalactose transaminase
LPGENARRAEIATRYGEALDGSAGLTIPFADGGPERASAHHLAVAVLPQGADRTAIRERLNERGIQTSVHYPPIHLFSQYRSSPGTRPLPRTEDVGARLLTLPLYGGMSDEQVELVIDELLGALAGAAAA